MAIKMLCGVSDEEFETLESKYCKHSTVAKKICAEYKGSMKKSDEDEVFDLREQSEVFIVEGKSETLTVVYPALSLKGGSF